MIRKINDKRIKQLGSGSDSSSINGNVIPILLKSIEVSVGTLMPFDTARVRALFRKGTLNSTTYNIYLYWNTTAALNGSEILLATYNVAGTEPSPCLSRIISFRENDTIDILDPTFSAQVDIGDLATASANPAVLHSVTGHFIAAAIRTSGARINDSILCSYLTLEV